LDPSLRSTIPVRLGRRLERYALNIARAAVRFRDINGPRGGVDTVCRIKLSVSGMDHIVVETRAADARHAFTEASRLAGRAVGRALERGGRTQPLVGRAKRRPTPTRPRTARAATTRSRTPRLSRRATVVLEHSAKERPSRKPTRKSAHRK